MVTIEKKIRGDIPRVGVPPYRQVHAHSTGNRNSTAQNEADYMYRKDLNSGFYTHVVGNGRIIQVAPVNQGAYDVGGGWNYETYAAVELIESHKTQEEFFTDYKLYVDLLRQLAQEAGLPMTLDQGDTGIISHNYATYNQPNNYSDHVDPYPYLALWGISKEQFAKDLAQGFTEKNVLPKKENLGGNLFMKLIIFDETLGEFKKGSYYLLNFSRGTYSHVGDPAELEFIRKAFLENTGRNIVEEHVSKAYPAHVRYIAGFKLKEVK